MNSELQTILEVDNPWLRGAPVSASAEGRLPDVWLWRAASEQVAGRWATTKRAHLLTGPRQCGKSSLIWRYLVERDRPFLFVDCEQALVRDWCRAAPLFLEDYRSLVPPGTALFLEEAQHLDEAGLFIKGLVDRGLDAPFLVTGSSSYHLLSKTRESLAGRASRTRLLTLSAQEIAAELATLPALQRRARMTERLQRHIAIGGYPEAWLSETPRLVLAELTEAFILRDASDLHRIQRPDAFRRLLHLAAGQVGSLVNLSEWASLLGVARDTVAVYLSILTDAHVLAELRPFAGGRRSELTGSPKVYFLDAGLRNQLMGSLELLERRTDRGPALESWVLTELAKSSRPDETLHFWRTTSGAEVDFVRVRGDRLLAVEVKATHLGRPKLPRATRSFIDAYQPDEVLIVNLALSHEDSLGDTRIRWLTPTELVDRLWAVP